MRLKIVKIIIGTIIINENCLGNNHHGENCKNMLRRLQIFDSRSISTRFGDARTTRLCGMYGCSI